MDNRDGLSVNIAAVSTGKPARNSVYEHLDE